MCYFWSAITQFMPSGIGIFAKQLIFPFSIICIVNLNAIYLFVSFLFLLNSSGLYFLDANILSVFITVLYFSARVPLFGY